MDASVPSLEVDVGGVRYEVLVPLFLWPEIQTAAGETSLDGEGPRPPLALHILYLASEKQPVPVLVGFLRRAERDFFRKLMTVEGIGPAKAAKALTVSVSVIARAIEQEDRATLTKLPGIGARGADKIIASLRGKVVAEAALQDRGSALPVDPAKLNQRRAEIDAVEAIAALGYSRAEARRWVDDALAADPGLGTVEEISLAVLRTRGAAG